VDVAFLRASIASPEGLVVYPLLEEPMVVALPTGHPLAIGSGSEAVPLRALMGETFIAYARDTGPALYEAMASACLQAGFSPRLGQEAPRITSALGLVAAGLGVCLVPASMLRVRMDGVAYRPLRAAEAPVVVLDLAVRCDATSPVLRNFLALARRAA
jgi:DNA-binding transcriptional LysR family regulator